MISATNTRSALSLLGTVIGVTALVIGVSHFVGRWFTYILQLLWFELAAFYLTNVNLSAFLTIFFGAISLYVSLRYA